MAVRCVSKTPSGVFLFCGKDVIIIKTDMGNVMLIELLNAIVSAITEWFKNHIGVVFMGVAGATVVALMPSNKSFKHKCAEWVIGIILCAALSTPTASVLTSGAYVEVFGFIYGMGGITLAKMILKAIEKRGKDELESKTGVKLDDDNS